jgi:hypothetical protein
MAEFFVKVLFLIPPSRRYPVTYREIKSCRRAAGATSRALQDALGNQKFLPLRSLRLGVKKTSSLSRNIRAHQGATRSLKTKFHPP